MDTLTPEQRSERMARVRSKDTKVEFIVRRLVYSMGFRYRLHSSRLPGHPDMTFRGRKKVIFVHGCFWHRHGGKCPLSRLPKSKLSFWLPKLEGNRRRDIRTRNNIRALGWNSLVVWECQLRNIPALQNRIKKFLEDV